MWTDRIWPVRTSLPWDHIQMSRFTLLLSFLALSLFSSGCSTMESLNPFSASTDSENTEEGVAAEVRAKQEDAAAVGEEPAGAAADDESEKTEVAAVERKLPAKPLQAESASTVELLWQVPTEAVEKYHIYYGLEADDLSNHIEIPVTELERIDHPKHGPVYRYELRGIPATRAIYLSLRAENKYGVSDGSTATKVEPGQKTVTP